MVDKEGKPLAVLTSAANVPEGKLLLPLVDAVPAIKQPRGGRRKRPDKVHADKAYDSEALRDGLNERGIEDRIARRGIENSTTLGCPRWVVERTISWFHRFRRLRIRYERDDQIHLAFLLIACALINWRDLCT